MVAGDFSHWREAQNHPRPECGRSIDETPSRSCVLRRQETYPFQFQGLKSLATLTHPPGEIQHRASDFLLRFT